MRNRRVRGHATMAVLALVSVALPWNAFGDCPDLFPKVTCFERIDTNIVTIYFGVDNFLNVPVTPVVNFFQPPSFIPPSTFAAGFTPRVFRITVDTTLVPLLDWMLGCQDLSVDTTSLPDDLLCASPVPGPAGAQGPPGPTGPTGPPGPSPFASCRLVSAPSTIKTSIASCGAGELLLTGGGSCDNKHGEIQSSTPITPQAWEVVCRKGSATATAICCAAP